MLNSLSVGQQEIPFWGVKTESGLANNTLRFWIGKTFLRSTSPNVALRILNENTFIEGTLSYEVVKFKNALTRFATLFNEEVIFDNDTQLPTNIEEIEIIQLFGFMYQLHHLFVYQNWDCTNYLRNYSHSMSEMISELINEDYYKLFDTLHTKIPNVSAYPYSITINTQTMFIKQVKTLFIYTCKEPYFPNGVKLSKTIKEYNREVELFGEDKYYTFKQNDEENIQPLLWINLKNIDQITVDLRPQERPLCKSVRVLILDTKDDEDQEYDQGISLAYISFRGLIINDISKVHDIVCLN